MNLPHENVVSKPEDGAGDLDAKFKISFSCFLGSLFVDYFQAGGFNTFWMELVIVTKVQNNSVKMSGLEFLCFLCVYWWTPVIGRLEAEGSGTQSQFWVNLGCIGSLRPAWLPETLSQNRKSLLSTRSAAGVEELPAVDLL